ncbi:MAG: DUF998 domain-containing protein [Actinomycetota bacterium]|nr:DUF998 domain-containing protein [Actinomycetota bacterium]
MGAQSVPHNLHLPSRDRSTGADRRLLGARITGMIGLGAYNWWLAAPLVPGMLRDRNGFFSDLSADGQPHAAMLHRLDTTAGILILIALLLRGPLDGLTKRPEWAWLVAFAVIAAVGGMFPYACSPGVDAACRRLQYGFALPLHHYVHMVSGVGEFFSATMAIWVARHVDPDGHTLPGRVGHLLLPALIVAYPILGYSYLGDRAGTLIEPVFFVMFSAIVVAELSSPEARSGAMTQGDANAMSPSGSGAELGLR